MPVLLLPRDLLHVIPQMLCSFVALNLRRGIDSCHNGQGNRLGRRARSRGQRGRRSLNHPATIAWHGTDVDRRYHACWSPRLSGRRHHFVASFNLRV